MVATAAADRRIATLQYFGALADPADPDRARIGWLRGRMVDVPLGEHLALVVVPNMAWGAEAARRLEDRFGPKIGPVLLLKSRREVWFFTGAPAPGATWPLRGPREPVLHTSGTAAMPSPTGAGHTWEWQIEPAAGVLTPLILVQAALADVRSTLSRHGMV